MGNTATLPFNNGIDILEVKKINTNGTAKKQVQC
jgi:hypothetical protein